MTFYSLHHCGVHKSNLAVICDISKYSVDIFIIITIIIIIIIIHLVRRRWGCHISHFTVVENKSLNYVLLRHLLSHCEKAV